MPASDAPNGRLGGKVAIVTGAGQTAGEEVGNGRATAILFAREGASVGLVDRDRAAAESTAEAIAADGGEALGVEGDGSGQEGCLPFGSTAAERAGPPP